MRRKSANRNTTIKTEESSLAADVSNPNTDNEIIVEDKTEQKNLEHKASTVTEQVANKETVKEKIPAAKSTDKTPVEKSTVEKVPTEKKSVTVSPFNFKKYLWSYINFSISISLLLLVAVLGYYFWLSQDKQQTQASKLQVLEQSQIELKASVQIELSKLKNQQEQSSQQLIAKTAQQEQYLLQLNGSRQQWTDQIEVVEDRLAQLAQRSPDDWLLYEANYLVQLAGFTLYLKRDFVTASTLLSSADERLIELSDPTLLSLRSALAKDIASIKALPKIDLNGLSLAINGLLVKVDNLKLQSSVLQPQNMQKKNVLSDSLADWQENLNKSWSNFMGDFVRITRRDTEIEPLLSPQEKWFLYQNVKTKLLQAQIALYREQASLYQQPLQQAHVWINTYFDDDATRRFVLNEITRLSAQPVQATLPENLLSPKRFKQKLKSIAVPTNDVEPAVKKTAASPDSSQLSSKSGERL